MMRKILPFGFFSAVTTLVYWKVIFHRDFTLLIGGDVSTAYYPWYDVAAYWLKKGSLLLWDPYVYAGKPFMGEPQPGLFYPLNWLFMLLPARNEGMNLEGMQAMMILDYLLLSCFTYALARSLGISPFGSAIAGVSFSFGGFTKEIFGYVNILRGFVWMPLAILTFRRAALAADWRSRMRWCVLSGICLGLTFLPGHHIPLIHTGIFLLLYFLFKLVAEWRSGNQNRLWLVASLASVPAIAGLLTALQWIPSWEWARTVYRWTGEGPTVRWGESVPYWALQQAGNILPQDALSLVLPYAGSNTSLYAGTSALFLCLIGLLFARAKESRFFSLSLFVYFLLSLGKFSALHGWMNTFVPGTWFAREVFHYLVPFHLCLSMLAGWGLDHLTETLGGEHAEGIHLFIRRAAWGMAVLVLMAVSLVTVMAVVQGLPFNHPYLTGTAGFAVYLTMLGVLLFLLRTERIRPVVFGALIISLLVVDLASEISARSPGKTRSVEEQRGYVRELWKKRPIVKELISRREEEYFRVDDPDAILPPNFGDVWRIEATMGHGATALVDYFAFRGTGWGPGSNATALLNVRYFPSRTPVTGMKKVFESGDERIYFNPRAVPRVFLASRFRAFESPEELLSWLKGPLFSPGETVLLDATDARALPAPFREGARNEDEGLGVQLLGRVVSAESARDALADEMARHRATVFQPPWGWSPGDSVDVGLHPETPVDRGYLVLNHFPSAASGCRLDVRLEGPDGAKEIPATLPAAEGRGTGEDQMSHLSVELGPLKAESYRLTLSRGEACMSRIDSLRVSRSASGEDTDAGSASITSYAPGRIVIEATVKRPSFLVLSELSYSGWKATVDGEATPILKGNSILRTIPVVEGSHVIELRFQPDSLRWGALVSILALLGAGVCIAIAGRRR